VKTISKKLGGGEHTPPRVVLLPATEAAFLFLTLLVAEGDAAHPATLRTLDYRQSQAFGNGKPAPLTRLSNKVRNLGFVDVVAHVLTSFGVIV